MKALERLARVRASLKMCRVIFERVSLCLYPTLRAESAECESHRRNERRRVPRVMRDVSIEISKSRGNLCDINREPDIYLPAALNKSRALTSHPRLNSLYFANLTYTTYRINGSLNLFFRSRSSRPFYKARYLGNYVRGEVKRRLEIGRAEL